MLKLSRPQGRSSLLSGWAWCTRTIGSVDTLFDWIESNKGNPIKSSVSICVRYRKYETADLIGFPLLDSIQSNNVSPEPLVHRAPGERERFWNWAKIFFFLPTLNLRIFIAFTVSSQCICLLRPHLTPPPPLPSKSYNNKLITERHRCVNNLDPSFLGSFGGKSPSAFLVKTDWRTITPTKILFSSTTREFFFSLTRLANVFLFLFFFIYFYWSLSIK